MWKKLLCVGDNGQQPSPPPSPPPPPQPTTTAASAAATRSRKPTPTLPQLAVQQPISAQSITHPQQHTVESPTDSTTPTQATQTAPTTAGRQSHSLPPLTVPSPPPPSHHLTPPTPIDPPSSTPSPSATPSSSSLSPFAFPCLSPAPAPTSQHPNPHPISSSQSQQHHHRRTSSTGSSSGSRAYRETLNAYAVDSGDGTRSVNQYRLMGESHLGKGSYATVERATDRETGVEYAIKEFSKRRLRQIAATEAARRSRSSLGGRGRGRGGRGGRAAPSPRPVQPDDDDEDGDGEKDHDQGPDNLELIKTEVAIMKKVEHPNIARVHEVIDVTSDDALLIVLELCAGGPILRISQGEQVSPMTEERAREVCRQLVLGIAYLHHNNIVHRDIKPDNCLFLADLHHVKLIDFGISKFTETEGDEGIDSKGSPAYMAPELLGGGGGGGGGASGGTGGVQHKLDLHGYACDVWSLGVTLYALVVGRLPFDDPDPSLLFKAIRESDPSIPTTLSPPLQSLLSSLLTKSPSDRPTIRSLWTDPWLTLDGSSPLPPYEENCISFPEPTQAEVDRALNALRASTFLAMSVVAKLKGMRRRSSSVDPGRERERSGTGMTSLSSETTGEEGSEEGNKTPLGGGQVVASPMSSPFLGATEFSTAPTSSSSTSSSSHAPPPAAASSPTPTNPPPQPQRQPTISLSPLDAVDGGPPVPSPLNGPSHEPAAAAEKEGESSGRIQRVEEPQMMDEPEEM